MPGKPGCPVVNRVSDRKVTLDWMPPDSDGGSRIIQYIIYHCSADVELESLEKPKTAGRSKSCTFSKQLTFNKTYKFAVAAENRFGIGPLSEFSESIKTPTRAGIVYRYGLVFCGDSCMIAGNFIVVTMCQSVFRAHYVSKQWMKLLYCCWQRLVSVFRHQSIPFILII